MDNSWENLEPSPIEFMHGRLQDEFHKWRKRITENTSVEIDGIEFNKIIVEAKKATYEKYKFMNLDKAIPKSAFCEEGMQVGFVGSVDSIEDIKRIIELHSERGVVIVVNNQEYAENIPLRPRLDEIEPLLIKQIPRFEEPYVNKKRTNHERLPSKYGKR